MTIDDLMIKDLYVKTSPQPKVTTVINCFSFKLYFHFMVLKYSGFKDFTDLEFKNNYFVIITSLGENEHPNWSVWKRLGGL